MALELVIDYRESALCKCLQDLSANYITENLLLGDIVIRFGEDKKQILILERKALDDLASSHLSNRYREQRARLLSERAQNGTRVAYLLEGLWSASDYRIFGPRTGRNVKERFLRTLVFRLQLKYEVPVIQTGNVAETAKMVAHLLEILAADPTYFAATPEADAVVAKQATSTSGNFSARRKDNVKPAVSMLMGIHGVSATKAEAILIQAGTISNLCSKSREEIAAYKVGKMSVGPKMADAIWTALHVVG